MNWLTRQRSVQSVALTALGAGVLVGGGALVLAPSAAATHVDPTEVPGNQNCDLFLGTTEIKIEDPAADDSGSSGDFSVSITVHGTEEEGNQTLDFTASDGTVLFGAIMKGGPDSNVYDYRPDGTTADTGLHTPVNPNNDKFFGISHVTFCVGEAPPTEPPPTTEPPTEPPPTEPPPTEPPPTEPPPTEPPPTEPPPTEPPPTEPPPTEPPPTEPPPTEEPPATPPSEIDAGMSASGDSDSAGWWPAGLGASALLLAVGAALALRRRGAHKA
ncbi:MAG: hypothetical protein GEU93_13635 [Propionibacteriales bacterium]|nr:hypothetical protein [Propionibacteriales bacterium]